MKNSGSSTKREDQFIANVTCIAREHGHDPLHIIPVFTDMSSTDFCLDAPTRPHKVPESVWQRVYEYYSLSAQSPFNVVGDYAAAIPTGNPLVFIPKKFTKTLVANKLIKEQGVATSAGRLYQYLNWTLRINKMAQSVVVMEGHNGRRVLLIAVGLHDQCGETLYALCTPNDVVADHVQKWQLAALLKADELVDLLGVSGDVLPRGARAASPQFEHLRAWALEDEKQRILRHDSRGRPVRYQQMKCVTVKQGWRGRSRADILEISLYDFCKAVHRALTGSTVLIPIVSILTTKKGGGDAGFSVDYLLPVSFDGQWVGVVYRDGEPVMALVDLYDITNKALLCDPSFDVDSLSHFKCDYSKLRLVHDHGVRPQAEPRPVGVYDDEKCAEEPMATHSHYAVQNRCPPVVIPHNYGNVDEDEKCESSPAVDSMYLGTPTHTSPIPIYSDSSSSNMVWQGTVSPGPSTPTIPIMQHQYGSAPAIPIMQPQRVATLPIVLCLLPVPFYPVVRDEIVCCDNVLTLFTPHDQWVFTNQQIDHHLQSAQYFQGVLHNAPSNAPHSNLMNETYPSTPSSDDSAPH